MKNGEYILVIAPENYPGKLYRKRYVYEHRLVWWQTTGTLVPPNFEIHHIDENKHNNAFENLELKSKSEHTGYHNAKRGQPPIITRCAWCKKPFKIKARNFKFKYSKGQRNFYCCRSHQVSAQQAERRELRSRVL